MKEKIIIFAGIGVVVLAVFVLALVGGRGEDKATEEVKKEKKIKVVTTILPLYLAAKEVGGPLMEVGNLIPLSSQPWGYAPSPEDKKKLEGAQLFIRTDTQIDQWAEGLAAQYPDMKELVLGRELRLLSTQPLIAGGNTGANKDPYFWLDPGRMMVAVGEIRDALIQMEPHKKQLYWAQTSAFIEILTMIDRDFRERFKGMQTKQIAASHNYLTYFVDSFGLNWVGAGTQRPERVPDTAQLAALQRSMTARGVKALFTPFTVPAWARDFAERNGFSFSAFDPMEFATSTAVTYDAVMRKNMQAMSEALGYEPEME